MRKLTHSIGGKMEINILEKIKLLWLRDCYPYREKNLTFAANLKQAREALLITRKEMARRLEINRATYYRIENNESGISLASLKRCTEAMDCEVTVIIRPKCQPNFSSMVWNQLVQETSENKGFKRWLEQGNWRIIFYLLKMTMFDPKTRKKLGWGRNFQDISWDYVWVHRRSRLSRP